MENVGAERKMSWIVDIIMLSDSQRIQEVRYQGFMDRSVYHGGNIREMRSSLIRP